MAQLATLPQYFVLDMYMAGRMENVSFLLLIKEMLRLFFTASFYFQTFLLFFDFVHFQYLTDLWTMLQEVVNKHVDDDCLTDVAETVAYLLTNQTVATHLERYKTAVSLDIFFSEFEHCIVSSKKCQCLFFMIVTAKSLK